MKNFFLIILLSTLLFSCKRVNGENHNSNNDSLTTNLQSAYSQDAIVGFSVAVADEKGLRYEKGFGFTDIQQHKSYTSNTTQNIGSISKTLIGIALLKAQEMGKLNLDDPINNYLPFKIVNPHHPDIPILIKHLAYHTSTITDLDEVYGKSYILSKKENADTEEIPDYFNSSETDIPVVEFIKNSLTQNGKWYKNETFSTAIPGEKRDYSNIGSALCALVIEKATGQDYRSFTKDHIMNPLKMKSSGWSSKDIDITKRSGLFNSKAKAIANYHLITYADGGFLTSSHDLGLFLSELIKGYSGNGTLLNKESYGKLFEKHEFVSKGKTEEYGIFMEFRDKFLYIQEKMVGHNGSDPGVFTAMYFNPDTKIGKVVLVNTDTDFTDNVWPEISKIWKSLYRYIIVAAK